MGTQITREVDSVLYTRAGLEMGVAASKTFTAQVALFYVIALKLAQVRKTLPEDEIASLLEEVDSLPDKIREFLDGDHPIDEVAQLPPGSKEYHDSELPPATTVRYRVRAVNEASESAFSNISRVNP